MKARYTDFPQRVVEKAKQAILDAIACGIGGSKTKLANMILHSVEDKDKKEGKYTLYGHSTITSCLEAIFMNGTVSNALDFDDSYEMGSITISHPGATIIPAALAVGEKIDSDGRCMIVSTILGYEVAVRVAEALEPRADEIWSFGNHQVFGACVAASKLLGLNADQMVNSLSIAGSYAPVPSTRQMWSIDRRPMSWVKEATGLAALSGALAALLAREGFVGGRNILDAKSGFHSLAGSKNFNEEKMIDKFGQGGYRIDGLSFKPYPSCRFTHPSLDAVSLICQEHDLKPGDIKHITVEVVSNLEKYFSVYKPKTMIDAEFSLPYVLTMVIMRIPVQEWYDPSKLMDEGIGNYQTKIKIKASSILENLYFKKHILASKVQVTLYNGRTFTEQINFAKGHPRNPLTSEELENKFKNLVSPVLGPARAATIIEVVNNLEEIKFISKLTQLFRATSTETHSEMIMN